MKKAKSVCVDCLSAQIQGLVAISLGVKPLEIKRPIFISRFDSVLWSGSLLSVRRPTSSASSNDNAGLMYLTAITDLVYCMNQINRSRISDNVFYHFTNHPFFACRTTEAEFRNPLRNFDHDFIADYLNRKQLQLIFGVFGTAPVAQVVAVAVARTGDVAILYDSRIHWAALMRAVIFNRKKSAFHIKQQYLSAGYRNSFFAKVGNFACFCYRYHYAYLQKN